ncbi:MAG: CIA30 family protein [Gammaproteobacteria bacterium]|nr:CIA30 family protein [Gammaproteobacteria bacterium]
MAGLAPFYSLASAAGQRETTATERLVLSDFTGEEPFTIDGARWRGFTDRVMGGVSDAKFEQTEVAGKRCARMSGRVTRDYGGGFAQMALYLRQGSDVSAYRGIELLVHGNDEDYNVHLRTPDCGWHSQSYRTTFRAESTWQTVRLPWVAFRPNDLRAPLDTTNLRRIGLLGWMRDFEADLALAEIALYV